MTDQAETTQTEQANGAAPPVNNEIEDRARKMGWVPKDEFRGDPDRWRPADEFVSRGENLLPILQSNYRKLQDEVSGLRTDNKELRETLTELRDFSRQASEREYKKARETIQAEITEAAREANPERANRAVQQLEALDAGRKPAQTGSDKPQDTKPQNPQVDPEIQAWIKEEKWFQSSAALNGFATEVYGELERDKPGMSTAERLAETKRRTMEMFPEKFGVQKRQTAAAVATPSGGGTPKKGRSYDDLPAEAKKACDRLLKTIPGYKREDYVRDFDWSSIQ